jgi:DNA-binding CsgD family transcriptional regulator
MDRPSVGLLEREHEIRRIRDVLRAAGQASGSMVVIEAPAGMGKSRLLDVARDRAVELGFRTLTARGLELEQAFPYGVVRQAFERLLIEASPQQRERWLAGAAELAGDLLLGVPGAASDSRPDAGSLDAGFARHHGLYWLVVNMSRDQPVAIIVDDLHWCDLPSAQALTFISRRLEGEPIALVLATRPLAAVAAPEATALLEHTDLEVLRPSALSPEAIETVVGAHLSSDPEKAFVKVCGEVTGGNPFLLGEMIEEARAANLDASAASAAALSALVPRGVARAVLARLTRLGPPVVALARVLSVLGDGAQVSDAARLTGLDDRDVASAMAALVSAGVTRPGGVVQFEHPLMQTAIYRDISSFERQNLHREAAALLIARGAPIGHVAAQVMRTEPDGNLETVELLRQAARAMLSLGDARGAAPLLMRALREPPGQVDRIAVMLELGQAHARAGAPEAVPALTDVVEQSEESPAISSAAIALAGMLFRAGRAVDAVTIISRARERLPDGDPCLARLEDALASASFTSLSARRGADGAVARLRDSSGPVGDAGQGTTLAILAMDEVMNVGAASHAIDLARRALGEHLAFDPLQATDSAMLALTALAVADALDTAQHLCDELLAGARKHGAASTVASLSGLRAIISFRLGDVAAAEADAQTATDLASELLGAEFLVLGVAALLAGLERGARPESLRRMADRSGVLSDPDFLPGSQLRYASAVLKAAAGDHETAVHEFLVCAAGDSAFGGENPAVVPWRSSAAMSLAELGRFDEGRELASDETRRARRFGAKRAIGIALRAEALVHTPAERLERLTVARDVLADSPDRLEHARVLTDLGAALRAAGQRRGAREPLLEGLQLAQRCGATVLGRRVRAELAAIGIRPRATARSGVGALTPSERRIVELAAGGATNREIAQSLFVTEKTVETHLGRAFRKLDVSSRRQLRHELATPQ